MDKTPWQRSLEIFPGGVNSPVRSFHHIGIPPLYFDAAKGAQIQSSGRQFIDFCMAFGPHILGHSPEIIVDAVTRQLSLGTSFGANHEREVDLGEEIRKSYPGKVRLLNSGTEAVMTALRIARAATGRQKILKFEGCYHGHFDGLLVSAGSGVTDLAQATSKGIPEAFAHSTKVARLDSRKSIEEAFDHNEFAAVILEPIPANEGLYIPPREHLSLIVSLARKKGTVVIFDEVITGYRLGLKGASGELDLKPDLVTLGKVIGGGLPLAALVGENILMDELAPQGAVYQAGTFSGNILSVTAGLVCLKYLQEHPPYSLLEKRTTLFCEELEAILSTIGEVQVQSLGSLFWFRFGKGTGFPPVLSQQDRSQFSSFYQKCLEKGVYFPPSPFEVGFLSLAHDDKILVDALEKIASAAREIT